MMNSKTSSPAAMFEKVLRAFETRGITYSDVLGRLRRLLAAGAPPKELLEILRRRGSTERMPEYGRLEALLLAAPEPARPGADNSPPAGESGAAAATIAAPAEHGIAADEVSVDLEFDDAAKDTASTPGLRASELDLSALVRHMRSADERTPTRVAALDSLTRSYERAKEGESVAAERATALAADLDAARDAIQAQQRKVRELEQALAESIASGEEARAEARLNSQSYQSELRALRASAATSGGTGAETRKALEERDARIAALSHERAILETALENRTKVASQLEADLRAARARAEALSSQPSPSREARIESTQPRSTASLEREEPRLQAASNAPPARERASAGRPGGGMRAIMWGAAALLLVAAAWLILHRPAAAPAPLHVEQAAALPDSGTVIRDCPTCPAMTVLPVGRFKQGSANGPAYEQPLHWVAINRPIALSKNPVTLADFEQFVAATGRQMQGCETYDGEWKQRPGASWERPGFVQTSAHPVTCVSWNDADAYAKWLSAKTGHRYRLPSASEWEYAARSGAESGQPWSGDERSACADANVADSGAGNRYPGWSVFPCDDGYVFTAPAGAFKANSFGLNDMLGNVLQWTEDCWHEDYLGAPVDGSARSDGDCSLHEVRGGSWFSTPSYVRADYRDRFPADRRTSSLGIRLARDLRP